MHRATDLFIATLMAILASMVSAVAIPAPEADPAIPPPPPPAPNFFLKTVVAKGGDKKFNNLFVASFHTGAGSAAAAAVPNLDDAATFYLLRNTFLAQNISAGEDGNDQEVPYSFGVDPTTPSQSTAPNEYNSVSINVGENTRNFYLSKTKSGTASFVHLKKTKKIPFKTFTVCDVDGIDPYKSVGPQKQILWRNASTEPVATGCADVRFKTVPLGRY
ncbi:MAG: hypothetical protein M1831_003095 [Alyxoria varia]|nr:MAG: hypothetical protein M1831_003095 [Alyxoria varia]